jgi:hypothetical protein
LECTLVRARQCRSGRGAGGPPRPAGRRRPSHGLPVGDSDHDSLASFQVRTYGPGPGCRAREIPSSRCRARETSDSDIHKTSNAPTLTVTVGPLSSHGTESGWAGPGPLPSQIATIEEVYWLDLHRSLAACGCSFNLTRNRPSSSHILTNPDTFPTRAKSKGPTARRHRNQDVSWAYCYSSSTRRATGEASGPPTREQHYQRCSRAPTRGAPPPIPESSTTTGHPLPPPRLPSGLLLIGSPAADLLSPAVACAYSPAAPSSPRPPLLGRHRHMSIAPIRPAP